MKRITNALFILLSGGIVFTACNSQDGGEQAEVPKDSSTAIVAAAPMDYPYKIDKPDNWDMGSNQNTLNALKALKAWENKNIDESAKYFADSVQLAFDAFEKKVSNDTLKSMFSRDAATLKNISIKMEDWESVISKDKKDEYVTLWYRQLTETNDGKKDSVDVINDIKMKDGKIIALDEFRRKLH